MHLGKSVSTDVRVFAVTASACFLESWCVDRFAVGLADLVKERGTNFIKSDEAKKILWVPTIIFL